MNRRIRKKREKQQLAQAIRELVTLAEKRQQKRQEAIDRFLTAYSAYLAKQGGAERTMCIRDSHRAGPHHRHRQRHL